VKLKEAPGLTDPLKTPVLLVTVWAAESLLVQITTVPTGTVAVAGEKANPWIFME